MEAVHSLQATLPAGPPVRPRSASARRPLDALNFFLADVQGGIGPYLAVYLLTVAHWGEARIGFVLTIGGIAAIVAQTPAGALVDNSHAKRSVVVAAAVIVTAGSLALALISAFWFVAAAQVVVGVAGAVFGPAIAAISLGIFGPRAFAARNGRNQAFNHAGNAAAAVAAGALSFFFGPIAVFWLLGAMAVASVAAALRIPAAAIDDEMARGLRPNFAGAAQPSAVQTLLRCRPLLIFGACTALFHFANAAMLPLVGQKLALADRNQGTALMSACIIAAQLVMVPMAMLVGARAERWGRKPLLIAAFAVLPVRGVLYTLSNDPFWLVSVQALDGVGAGLFGALLPLVVADLTRGTGHFNVAQGAVTTMQGIGAAVSMTAAGLIVVDAGFSAAFLFLGAAAAVALLVLLIAMPETRSGYPAAAPVAPPPPSPALSPPSP